MDDETRRIDRSWDEGSLDETAALGPTEGPSGPSRRDQETPTAELDLPDMSTRRLDFGDASGGTAGGSAGDVAGDAFGNAFDAAPTQRFETVVGPTRYPDDDATFAHAGPVHPVTQPPVQQAAVQQAPVPAQPVPAPAQHVPVQPVQPAYAPAAMPARPVGPNGFARFGSVVLALGLTVVGLPLIAYALMLVGIEGVNAAASGLLGSDAVAVPGSQLRVLFLAGGVLALLLAALTARLSGLGVGITGVLLVLVGLTASIWPGAFGDWLLAREWFPQIEGLDVIVQPMLSAGFSWFGVIALVVGAMFIAIAGAVNGARRAGWERGRGY